MATPAMVGPFRLDEPIARGGMSEVWLGAHAPRATVGDVRADARVAIKVLTGAEARSRSSREAFHNEVRAAARLMHPSITMVLDHGEISAETAASTGNLLVEHSPWIAMEYSGRGTLGRFRRPLPYPRLQAILLALLDALAHAHARGVIHRDVKPGNVLLSGPDDMRPGLKLTDFGIAHALDRHHLREARSERAGTLHYMAPEQILGEWRDHGPWTDLYAMGCLGWRMVTGRPPFAGHKDSELSRAQLEDEPALFEPVTAVPDGFEAWLRTLLQKDPQSRFLCCADAARGLLALGVPNAAWEDVEDPTLDLLRPPPPETWSDDDLPTVENPRVKGEIQPTGHRVEIDAPVPERWDRPDLEAAPLPLLGAGLGVYGLRTVPLVARELERDILWKALRETADQRTVTCCVIEGAAGIGKTRLAEWLAQRVSELGVATVLQAVHEPNDSPGEPLRRMLERFLVANGLDRDAVHDRIQRLLGPWGLEADEMAGLAELLVPSDRVRFGAPSDRRALVSRCVDRLSQVRPVLLWLEDAAWGADALAFAHSLLDRRHTAPIPVMIVITSRSETLAVRPLERPEMERLYPRDGVTRIQLGPLGPRESRVLVQKLLRLDSALAARLEERAAGNPSFAVQVVGDWVQRGVLVEAPSGFDLLPGEQVAVPHDLASVWSDRIAHVLEGANEEDWMSLERAATLGTSVDAQEWEEVCAGLSPVGTAEGRARVLEKLLGNRLATLEGRGWVFAHGMLRDALLTRAWSSGRDTENHLACAALLEHRRMKGQANVSERLGRHLLEGGEPQQAIEPLLAGVKERERTLGFGPALALLAELELAFEQMGVPETDPRRVRAALERTRLRHETGDLDGAIADAERIAVIAKDLPGLVRQANLLRVRAMRVGHGPERVGTAVDELIELATRNNDKAVLAAVMFERALVLRSRHEIDRADAVLRAARALFLSVKDEVGAAACLRKLADHQKNRGNLDAARESYLELLRAYARLGDRSGAAYVQNGLGEVARRCGRLEEAEQWYRRSLDAFEALGGMNMVVPKFNLGLVLIEQRRWAQALAWFESVRPMLERIGMRPFIAAIHAAMLPCFAALGDWSRWDAHLALTRDMFVETGALDPDAAQSMSLAAELAHQARELDRADTAARLAIGYWRALGIPAQSERAERWLRPAAD